MRPTSAISASEARYTAGMLAECEAKQMVGLVDLLRFGIASSGSASGACVAAAWLLNAARFKGLPRVAAYQRADGSGFYHCDGDWLEARALLRPDLGFDAQFLQALESVGAPVHVASGAALDGREPQALLLERSIALVLAINAKRRRAYCCEIEPGRARLKWLSLEQTCRVVGLARDLKTPAALADAHREAGEQVIYLDTPEGLLRLPQAEGLEVVAYAALHGNTQRDLSSCNVASLSSVALAKGARGRVIDRAATLTAGPASDPQGILRAVAAQHLEGKGVDFELRGLSLDELGDVARNVGLTVTVVELRAKDAAALVAFRAAARAHLGRIIVNFSRPHLRQQGSGHHSVLVAYHAASDAFLVDDPAGFKLPPFWVGAATLLEAMATFDGTKGVERHRGYVLIQGETDAADADDDLSASILLRPSTPRG